MVSESPRRRPAASGGCAVSALRALLFSAGGIGFLLFVTSIERLAESGKLRGGQVGVGLLLATACAAGSLGLEAFVHRGRPWLRRELLRHLGCAGFALGSAVVLLGSAWAFVTLQKETGVWAVDLGGFRAPVLAAIVTTVTIVIGALIGLAALERRIRDPEKVPPVTRARILALRGEGKSLQEIAAALDTAKLTAPGGVWTGHLLRGVIQSAPQWPPPGGPRQEEMEPPSAPSAPS